MPSNLEERFASLWLEMYPYIKLHSEHRFNPKSRHRFDFVHLPTQTAIELQGGTWSNSKMGHNSGSGIKKDCIKMCIAQSLGWAVFPLTTDMVTEEYLMLIAQTIYRRMERWQADGENEQMMSSGALSKDVKQKASQTQKRSRKK